MNTGIDSSTSYVPDPSLLEAYARVLIHFALNSGEGVKSGQVVYVQIPESAKPFYVPLRNTLLKAGAIPLMQYLPEQVREADGYMLASEDQLRFFPEKYYRGLVDQIDHSIGILAEADKYALKEVEPKRILTRVNAYKPYKQWREEKEATGQFTWTLAMYGTEAMAADVGLTMREYWEQIIAACYLDTPDPVAAWRDTFREIERIRGELNALPIEKVTVKGERVNLTVGIGPYRQWLGGSGRNIPSFELFISPDCRQTEGEIFFNQPLYHFGNVISGIYLRFREGRVVEAKAEQGEALLTEMLAAPGADRIGEFSLTDRRFSRITKVMGETLFDENMGGPQGNTHIAVGSAYKDSYVPAYPATAAPESDRPTEISRITESEWEALGYNQSAVHTDIISTEQREVTATLRDGTSRVIYRDGEFTL
jgi:aminopeptidase